MDQQSNEQSVFQLSLLENGLDFILSAAECAVSSTPRSLKNAMLHLADGMELVIKAILAEEGWALLFDSVDNADRKKLESGDFKSVDFKQAYRRLRNIAGVEIPDSTIRKLDSLRNRRNVVRHYKAEIELAQVKSLLADVLDFCHDFCMREFPKASVNGKTKTILGEIWEHLKVNADFVSSRLQTIAPSLEGLQVWSCPDCWNSAVVGIEDELICNFCITRPDPGSLAVYNTIGGSNYCACCGDLRETVGLVKPESDGGAVHYCFYCGSESRNLEECFKCNEYFLLPGGAGGDVWCCDSCWEYILA